MPGGAGNAANNVAALGGTAALVAAIGRDEPGRRVLSALHRRVDPRHLVRMNGAPTPVKTRILAGGVHSAKQQVVRIDRAVKRSVDGSSRKTFERAVLGAIRKADAVLLSDGGGKASAVGRPLHGGLPIAKVLVGFARLPGSRDWRMQPARINGLPGGLVFDGNGQLLQTVALAPSAIAPDRIGAIYIQRNPEKPRGLLASPGRSVAGRAIGDVTSRTAGSS